MIFLVIVMMKTLSILNSKIEHKKYIIKPNVLMNYVKL